MTSPTEPSVLPPDVSAYLAEAALAAMRAEGVVPASETDVQLYLEERAVVIGTAAVAAMVATCVKVLRTPHLADDLTRLIAEKVVRA